MARKKHRVGVVGPATAAPTSRPSRPTAARWWRSAAKPGDGESGGDSYGVPQVFERWEQMLGRAKPEIVVIARRRTPPPHRDGAFARAPTCCARSRSPWTRGGARHGGRGGARAARRDDWLQLALLRGDAALHAMVEEVASGGPSIWAAAGSARASPTRRRPRRGGWTGPRPGPASWATRASTSSTSCGGRSASSRASRRAPASPIRRERPRGRTVRRCGRFLHGDGRARQGRAGDGRFAGPRSG